MREKYYIAKSPYGYTVGEGKTEKDAWEDAYGQKPWNKDIKRQVRDGWIEETTRFKAEEEIAADANREPDLPGYYDEELVGGPTGDNG